ncbi:carbohydrate kinase [Alkalicoccus urumqiensis]|nr:carbohydrate kinase [Alkalicoccus urumqiensis]
MGKKEEILSLIRQNAYYSQQELADLVGLSRSACAGYISQLMRDGEILGKAYVLKEEKRVCCIGGANLDRKMTVEAFRWKDSNPVTSHESFGGVARNLAENMHVLGLHSQLMTVLGSDEAAGRLTADCRADTSLVQILPQERTGTYTAVMESSGEMLFALADMAIYDAWTPAVYRAQKHRTAAADVLVLDTNLPQETMKEILSSKLPHQKAVIVPVSAAKISRIPQESIQDIDLLLLNELEAEAMAAHLGNEADELEARAANIVQAGAGMVIVTRGAEGVYMASEEETAYIEAEEVKAVDVTGAGDAFASVCIDGLLHDEEPKVWIKRALARAAATIQSTESVIRTQEGKR